MNNMNNMNKLWLLFAQVVTVCVAIIFVVTTLQPHWLNKNGWLALNSTPANRLSIGSIGDVGKVQPNDTPRPTVNLAPIASFADAAARSSKTVVNVFTKQKRPTTDHNQLDARLNDPFFKFFFGDKLPPPSEEGSSLGSGVMVSTDEQGTTLVITNNHVIDGADAIELVLTDGRRVQATLVGTDPETDIAILRTQLPHAPIIEWGNLSDVRVGDAVLAVGNPFGVGQTVTQGIVSALGRNHLGINTFENFIQTDAAINPGNSGGALTDSQGRLIGINTAIYSKDGGSLGIGFAIPVTTVKHIMTQLLNHGVVTRGYIGITPEDVNEATRKAFEIPEATVGCVVLTVQDNAPAARAGLLKGDVIVQLNGTAITDRTSLLNTVAAIVPDTLIPITVWRQGKTITLNLTVGKRPKQTRPMQ